jgi:hypothetical protein
MAPQQLFLCSRPGFTAAAAFRGLLISASAVADGFAVVAAFHGPLIARRRRRQSTGGKMNAVGRRRFATIKRSIRYLWRHRDVLMGSF